MRYNPEALQGLSNADLQALANNEYQKLSHAGLKQLSAKVTPTESKPKASFWDTQKREAKGLLQGAADFGTDLGNLYIRASNGLGRLLDPNLQEFTGRVPHAPILNKDEKETNEAKVGEFLGEMIPSLFIPEAKIAQTLTKSGKAINWLGNLLTRNVPRAVDTGINSGLQSMIFSGSDDRQPLGNSFLQGAGIGMALHGALGLPSGLAENYFKSLAGKARKGLRRSPEEIAKYSDKLTALPVYFPSLVKNVATQPSKTSTLLQAMPFSGVKAQGDKLLQHVNEHSQKLVQDLLGNSAPETLESELLDAIRFNRNEHRDNAEKLFNKLLLNVELARVKVKPDMLRQTANQILKANKKSLFPLYGRTLNNALEKIKRNTRYSPSFAELHYTNSDMYKIAHELQRKGENREAAQLIKLQDAIHQDIDYALQESKKPELMTQWREARQYFKDNVLPYRQRYLFDVLDKNKAPQVSMLSRLLSKRYEKVFSDLNPSMKSKLAYLYFNKAMRRDANEMDRVEPQRLAELFQKMPVPIKQKLLNAEQQRQFDRLLALTQVMPKTINQHNALHLLRTGEIGGLGYLLGSHLLSPVGMGAGFVVNKWLMNYLHSPKAREHYVKQQVGNPALNAKITRLLSAPINLSLEKTNDNCKTSGL